MDHGLQIWLALAFIAAVHLLAGHLRFLSHEPRSRWLSAGGGWAVAYAFLHLLPELSAHHEVLREASGDRLEDLEHHAYLLALSGLASFYGLERWAKGARSAHDEDRTPPKVFWVSIASFALYNALLGYVLAEQAQRNGRDLVLFTLAVAVHFAVNDHGLYAHHKHLYARYGRWLLAGSAFVGGTTANWLPVSEPVMAGAMAFLIGAIVLNVLKEELPEERESRFGAFALGALAYALLLQAA
jgi:zinc transporter ZupT